MQTTWQISQNLSYSSVVLYIILSLFSFCHFVFHNCNILQQELELELGLAFNHVTMEQMESIRC